MMMSKILHQLDWSSVGKKKPKPLKQPPALCAGMLSFRAQLPEKVYGSYTILLFPFRENKDTNKQMVFYMCFLMWNWAIGKRFSNEWVTHVRPCRLLHHEMGNCVGKEKCWEVAASQQGSRHTGWWQFRFFTLITQSRVSADGSIYKGVSVGFV